MSGAKRAYFEFVEQQEVKEALEAFERRRRNNEIEQMGQSSPANDGIFKGNEDGIYRN